MTHEFPVDMKDVMNSILRAAALVCFVLLWPLESWAGEARLWEDLLAQEGQDGSFEQDEDLDKKPDRWLQFQDRDAGYMHYGVVNLEKGVMGERQAVLVANGTNVGLQMRNPVEVDSSFSYLLEGCLELAGIRSRGGEARVVIEWLDGDRQVLSTVSVYRDVREGARSFSVEIHEIPRGTRFARIRLEIVQTPIEGLGPSIEGRVAFDGMRFFRRPRSEFNTGARDGTFWRGGNPPVFTVRYWGLPSGAYKVEQEVWDFQGRVVARDSLVQSPVSGEIERVWRPENLSTGWFFWKVHFSHEGKPLIERRASFVILNPDDTPHEGFGIDCGRPVGDGAGDQIARLGPAFVMVQLAHDDGEVSPLMAFLKWMKLFHIETFGVVRPPVGVSSILAWLERADPRADSLFARTSRWVDVWLIDEKRGVDHRDLRWRELPRMLSGLIPFQGGDKVRVGTFFPFLPEGVDFWCLGPEEAMALGDSRSKRLVKVRGMPGDPVSQEGCAREVSDFIRTCADLKHWGVEQMAIDRIGPGGCWDALGAPTPFLACWHQWQSRLAGARPWREAHPTLPLGVDGRVFERDGKLVVVVWSKSDAVATWRTNLGADVVAEDIMGNRVPVEAMRGGSVFHVPPVPIYIQGVDIEVVRTILSIKMLPDKIPASEEVFPLTLEFVNHFTNPMQGILTVDLGPGWRIEESERIFSALPKEKWIGRFQVTPSAKLEGEAHVHPAEVVFRLHDRGRERVLRWSHSLSLAAQGFSARYTLITPEVGEAGLAELMHEVVSSSLEPLVLASLLSLPGEQDRMIQFGVVPPGAKALVLHRFPLATLREGASVTVQEVGGERRFWRIPIIPLAPSSATSDARGH